MKEVTSPLGGLPFVLLGLEQNKRQRKEKSAPLFLPPWLDWDWASSHLLPWNWDVPPGSPGSPACRRHSVGLLDLPLNLFHSVECVCLLLVLFLGTTLTDTGWTVRTDEVREGHERPCEGADSKDFLKGRVAGPNVTGSVLERQASPPRPFHPAPPQPQSQSTLTTGA